MENYRTGGIYAAPTKRVWKISVGDAYMRPAGRQLRIVTVCPMARRVSEAPLSSQNQVNSAPILEKTI